MDAETPTGEIEMTDARTVIAGWLTEAEWKNNFENARGMSTNDHADAILAALAEAGLVIVPREATKAMSLAGFDEYQRNTSGQVSDLWRAMVEASE